MRSRLIAWRRMIQSRIIYKKEYEHNENHVIINIVRFNSWIMYIYTILHACSKLGWVIQEPQIKIIEYWLYWRGIKMRQSTTPKAHTNTHLPNKKGKKEKKRRLNESYWKWHGTDNRFSTKIFRVYFSTTKSS